MELLWQMQLLHCWCSLEVNSLLLIAVMFATHMIMPCWCVPNKYPIPTVPSASSYNSPSNQAAWLFSQVAVLNEVREFALPNFLGEQCAMASNFNVDSWSRYLDHYQDRVILDFLQYGWPVNYTSSVLASSTFHNHPSAAKNCDYLSSCT